MKFQFNPDLDYQAEAIASIVDIFEGQEPLPSLISHILA